MEIQKLTNFLKQRYRNHSGAVHRRSASPFEVLISCVLSQRTRDENTELASKKLFAVANTPEALAKLEENKIAELIKPAGFYNQKAKKLKQISQILLDKYNGEVPSERECLLELPGVGVKTTNVTLSYCFDKSVIPVDVHVNVIAKRLGFAEEKDDVETVRHKLEKLIPGDERYHVHLELIHFGKEICTTAHPKCYLCPFIKECLYENKNLK